MQGRPDSERTASLPACARRKKDEEGEETLLIAVLAEIPLWQNRRVLSYRSKVHGGDPTRREHLCVSRTKMLREIKPWKGKNRVLNLVCQRGSLACYNRLQKRISLLRTGDNAGPSN